MRKRQQKQILEFIQTLKEATEEIKRLFSRKEFPGIIQLLADCQDSAVEIGSFIEEIVGDGTQTVSFLEEYCDLLYQISSELESLEANFTKKIKKQLIKIESSVHGELRPDRIEMVFLPYKASMWDSMESVWLAAKDDPQCDAFVAPIPYYDRLPGGGMGQMHYEGDQYPAYVPVIDWRQYDIEARHPDAVFIHNPYDEMNLVTSVHPDYYCGKLKAHADMLCYIPYFVVGEDIDEHFCGLPGVLQANKVFVQSEVIRDRYIQALMDVYKISHNISAKHAEGKIVALGSPKFDKVIRSGPEAYTIPPEWQRLIEKSDGKRKKIVLFNSTLGALLEGNEQYVKKLEHVLHTFSGYHDIVLWWRPHPLLEKTCASMRPALLQIYQRLVAEYKSNMMGIYDDTMDIHRAIAFSDAYYGDRSSVVQMFGLTGKPIMIQDISAIDCCMDEKFFQPAACAGCGQDEELHYYHFWMSDNPELETVSLYHSNVYPLDENGIVHGQKQAFAMLTAYPDGESGQHIYQYVKEQIL